MGNARRWTRALQGGALVAALLLAGCAAPIRLDTPAPVDDRNAAPAAPAASGPAGAGTGGNGDAAGGAAGGPLPASTVTPVDLGAGEAVGAGRVVYFDLDSFVIKPEFSGVIESSAKALTANRQRRLLVEGHTDERGGREYNLALAQKRADAVVRALLLLGPKEAQIESASYGKERPAVEGSNEAAWAKNRRVELKDR